MPHIAFDLRAMEDAPNLARAAAITEDTAIAGLARTWKHCWAHKTDRVDAVLLRGFFGADVAVALVAFGFVENTEEGPYPYRVRGSDRYLRIAAGHSKGGKAAARNLIPGGPKQEAGAEGGAEGKPRVSREGAEDVARLDLGPTPSTEHRTPIETTADVVVALPPRPPETAEAAETELNGDEDGNYPDTPFGFFGWAQSERRLRGLTPERDPPQKLLSWYPEARRHSNPEGLSRAYRRYLEAPDFETRGWPFRVFMAPSVYEARTAAPTKAVRL